MWPPRPLADGVPHEFDPLNPRPRPGRGAEDCPGQGVLKLGERDVTLQLGHTGEVGNGNNNLMVQCRVGPAGHPAGPPSEPCVPLIAAHGSSKPRGRGWLKRWLPVLAGDVPAVAGGVCEAGLVTVRRPGFPVMGEVAGRYRPAGELQPPAFPRLRRLGGLFGGQEMIPAQWAARILPGEQAHRVPVQRGFDLHAPLCPVFGQGGVIGRCRALDHDVPDDACPGEFRDVSAGAGHRTPSGHS